MKKLAKILISACMVALVSFGCVALSGCSQSDEDAVRDGVTSVFDGFKNVDYLKLASLVDSVGETEDGIDAASLTELPEQYGVDPQKAVTSLLDGFDYEIESIEFEGDVAHVSVLCQMKDADYITDRVTRKTANWALEHMDNGSTDAQDKAIGEFLLDAIESADVVSHEFSFDVEKEDGKWDCDKAVAQALVAELMPSL